MTSEPTAGFSRSAAQAIDHVRAVDSGEPNHFTVARTSDRRPFRSQRFVLGATIAGGVLGTTEVGGSTDFARWVKTGNVPALEPRADVVDIAMAVLR
ncbi:MAG: hypothetical protein WBG36_01670 [Ornithinimicrobium sp.]